MAEARQKVKDLTNEANVIVLKIADLQNKFYSMDDGFKTRRCSAGNSKVVLRAGPQQAKPGKGKAELQDLENEARKSGALPRLASHQGIKRSAGYRLKLHCMLSIMNCLRLYRVSGSDGALPSRRTATPAVSSLNSTF